MIDPSTVLIRPAGRAAYGLRVFLFAAPAFGLLFSALMALATDKPFVATFWPLGALGGVLFGFALGVLVAMDHPPVVATVPHVSLREVVETLTLGLAHRGYVLDSATDDMARYRWQRTPLPFLALPLTVAGSGGDLLLSGLRPAVESGIAVLAELPVAGGRGVPPS